MSIIGMLGTFRKVQPFITKQVTHPLKPINNDVFSIMIIMYFQKKIEHIHIYNYGSSSR